MGIGQIWKLNNLYVSYLDAINWSLENEDISDGIKLKNGFVFRLRLSNLQILWLSDGFGF